MLILLGIVTVFPAYAGVIPTVDETLRKKTGLSRVCGGDPAHEVTLRHEHQSFPRMRG